MISKKFTLLSIVIGTLILICAGIIYIIISFLYGNPIERYSFKSQVNEYLIQTYPQMKVKNIEVRYDFKEEDFRGDINETETDINFLVKKNNNGQLEDWYASATWEAEIKQACLNEAGELFVIPVTAFVDIRDTGKRAVENFDTIPRFSEVSGEMASQTQITFEGNITDKDLDKIVKVSKWLVSKNYYSDVSFISEQIFISIPYHALHKIKNTYDLEEFKLS